MSNDKRNATGGTFKFNTGGKAVSAKGGITTLPAVQKAFKDNCRNIGLNLAKLESAGAFTKGGMIECRTDGTTIIMPDGTRHELFDFDGDMRKGAYAIATDPVDIANIEAANAKKAAAKKAEKSADA